MADRTGDILHNSVKDKLARGEVVASMTVRLIRTVEIARIARTAGFDSLYVDIEHSSFSLDTCSQICMAALEAGIALVLLCPQIPLLFMGEVVGRLFHEFAITLAVTIVISAVV